jgi:hypothetical protein
MPVNFAAVHDRKLWRKHSIHQTLHAAIDGKDGAKNLLLRIGRVADMWVKHGNVHCVFVWEDGSEHGNVFRLDPERSGVVQSATVSVDRVLFFHKNRGCSPSEIAECFGSSSVGGTTNPIQNDSPDPPIVNTLYPDDLPLHGTFIEGIGQQVLVNRFERSSEARSACIAHYGCICQVCDLNFNEKYGELGIGFIHVHHRVPIASIGASYRVDPVNDLVPVCPNCHAMLHRREPPLEIDELRALVHDG